jgi:hypothetical protein
MKFAIIIGAMKSGTSAIFSILKQHPEICACKIKEPEFFVNVNYKIDNLDEYKQLWEFDFSRHKYALEASTSYTKMPSFANAAERIKNSGIEAKFIYIMRNPIDRIESQLKMSMAENWEAYDSAGRIYPHIISVSRYFYQIHEYFKRFPANDILLLSFEEYVLSPERTIQKVSEFLELDSAFRFHFEKIQKHDGLQYAYKARPKAERIKNRLIKLRKKYKKNHFIYMLLNNIEIQLDKKVKNSNLVSETERSRIKGLLKEEIIQLNKEYNFDTDIWDE